MDSDQPSAFDEVDRTRISRTWQRGYQGIYRD